MFQRILGVLSLKVATYEEIEHDNSATTQAVIIVAIVALLGGIGGGIGAQFAGGNVLTGFIGQLVWGFAGWLLWSLSAWLVGTKLFNGQATIDEMLRVIGFAYTPLVLGIIPCIGAIIGGLWALVTGFFAVRQGLDLDNTKALLTIVVGFIVYLAGNWAVNSLIGGVTGLFGM